MPRFEAQRITSRPAVDSSQSANIALPVQADLNAVRGQGSAMWSVSSALSGVLADKSQKDQRIAAQRQAQADEDARQSEAKLGATKAADHELNGVDQTEWLANASKIAKQSYEETDGINAVSKFQSQLQEPLAKLEPGADIDGFVKQHAEQFIADNGLKDGVRDTFMVGLAKSQDDIKQAYLKQSIKESMKREEDGASALLVDGLTKGNMATPEGYAQWRAYNASKGMSDDEMDNIAVSAVKASLASGDIDIAKGMSILQTASAPGRPVLADIPEHKEELQLAAKRGQAVQDDRAKAARYDQEVQDTVQVDALAQKGILGNARALAWGKANDKSAAEVAAKINSSREARERLSDKLAKEQRQRDAMLLWNNHDPLSENRAGFSADEIAKAGDTTFTAALQSGDATQVAAVVDHAMRSGAPIPALKGILSSTLDPSNPQQATQYALLVDRMFSVSPARASAELDSKALATYTQYKQAKLLGADDSQAWSKVKMGTNLDSETITKNVTEAMKLVAKDAPKDFTSEHFWQSNTPIANLSELDTAYRLSVKDMVEAGAAPDVAAKAALTRVQSSYIRVGDRMVRNYGTGDGMDKQTSEAMTEASNMWKDKLVEKNVVGKDDPVMFAPIPGSPNTWRLKYFAAGGVPLDVTHEVTKVGEDGREHTTTEFVDVIPSATRANYAVWKQQEDTKRIKAEQFAKNAGTTIPDGGLTAANVAKINAAMKQSDDNWSKPAATELQEFGKKNWFAPEAVAKRTKVSTFFNDPSNHSQSFADFITSNH